LGDGETALAVGIHGSLTNLPVSSVNKNKFQDGRLALQMWSVLLFFFNYIEKRSAYWT
jgi:hypothetical protein